MSRMINVSGLLTLFYNLKRPETLIIDGDVCRVGISPRIPHS